MQYPTLNELAKKLNQHGSEIIVVGEDFRKKSSKYPSLISVESKKIDSLNYALYTARGKWIVFTTIGNLLNCTKEILSSLIDASGLAVCNKEKQNIFEKLLGIRRIVNSGYIAFDRDFFVSNYNPSEYIKFALKHADSLSGIVFSSTKDTTMTNYINRPITLIRPTKKIITRQTKRVIRVLIRKTKSFVKVVLLRYKNYRLKRSTLSITFSPEIPVFIICRDRFKPLKQLVKWIEEEGLTNIIFIDNDSTYPPLVEYLKNTKYEVLWLRKNVGHTSPWSAHIINAYSKGREFIVTDPDVIPTKESHGAIKRFVELFNKYPGFTKIGLGLKIDDLPSHYKLRDSVITWESQFWNHELEKDIFIADTDTTFAMYRANTQYCIAPALRTGGKFVAQHEPWYQNSDQPDEELLYYRSHANKNIGTWGIDSGDLADFYVKYEESTKKIS